MPRREGIEVSRLWIDKEIFGTPWFYFASVELFTLAVGREPSVDG
jgi:hypothetical protein